MEEKQQSSKELLELLHHTRGLIEASPDIMIIVNRKGIIIDVNQQAVVVTGVPRGKLIGASFKQYFTDPDRAEKVFKEETVSDYKLELIDHAGDIIPVSWNTSVYRDRAGKITGVYAIARDITALKRAEKELVETKDHLTKEVELEDRIKEERDNLNLIFESMIDEIYIVSKDYEIEFMNKVLIDKVGDQTGDICYKVFHNREEPCPLCKSSEVTNGKTVRWEWYSRRMNKTYDLIETPLTNIDGTISKLTIFRDITDQKRLEEKAQAEKRHLQLLNELEKANRDLKDFAYIVSHDLKAPLRAINSLAEWLSADYSDKLDEEGKEQLDLLRDRARRMYNLIESILQYSRIGRSKEKKKEIDFNTLVSEIITMINPPVDIDIKVVNKLPTILCEKVWMEQVFQNLLSNAVRYMDKPKGKIRIGCCEEDEYWKFCVSDNGPGIEEKYYEKIFQIFQTLKPRDEVGSTGVGLTIVGKIVEAQGGEIWLDSKVGVGSTFFFTIPKESKEGGGGEIS